MKAVTLTTDIPSNREIRLQLPSDTPLRTADIVVVIAPRAQPDVHTLGELLHSDFFGMWRERTDIDDTIEFDRKLRDTAWRRSE